MTVAVKRGGGANLCQGLEYSSLVIKTIKFVVDRGSITVMVGFHLTS